MSRLRRRRKGSCVTPVVLAVLALGLLALPPTFDVDFVPTTCPAAAPHAVTPVAHAVRPAPMVRFVSSGSVAGQGGRSSSGRVEGLKFKHARLRWIVLVYRYVRPSGFSITRDRKVQYSDSTSKPALLVPPRCPRDSAGRCHPWRRMLGNRCGSAGTLDDGHQDGFNFQIF